MLMEHSVNNPSRIPEESLGPSDWPALRRLGHRMLDDMFAYLQGLRQRAAWQPVPEAVAAELEQLLPLDPMPEEDVYRQFQRTILPYPLGNIHPRFWGWVMGGGTPLTMLAEMLAAGMNPNMANASHATALVELQVLKWLKALLGMPPEAGGILVSGGSVANLTALAVARTAGAGFDVRQEGLAMGGRRLTLYGSTEMHSSIQRAVEVLGLGNQALRRIPVDSRYQIRLDGLSQAIEADLADGCQPLAVIGNAGTVNTGAIDPLGQLADIAAEYGLWFHVDGAFGALANLVPELQPKLAGLERADSLAFDLHKWPYLPFEAGCTLVRDREIHRRTFVVRPDYLESDERGVAAGPVWFSDYGIQLSRGFRALKVWMAFKSYGVHKLSRLIAQNVAQAHYLSDQIERLPSLELLAPAPLNIVCFRYNPGITSSEKLNRLNHELLLRLQESGAAVLSSTMLEGRYALRCAITNHRSRREDFDLLIRQVVMIGNQLVEQGWTAGAADA
jgi:aromatic-L-amino-acid decarboxylase